MEDIYKGEAANDKTGTPARQAADIINGNFAYLDSKITTIVNPDRVLKYGEIETDGLNVHIDADAFEWCIDQFDFLDAPEYDAVLVAATDGYFRTDVLLGNDTGGYNIFKGTEDPVSAPEPTLFPVGTIKLGVIHVFGDSVTGTVIDVDGFITKAEKSFIRMFLVGNVDKVEVDNRTYLKFEAGMLSLKSINIADSKHLYHGKEYTIKNGTGLSITLFHNQGAGNFKFNIPGAVNLVLKPEETVSFVMRAINYTNNGGLLDFVGTAGVDLNAPNLKFGGYPNSRNDGQISVNKVLTTDSEGYLKLVTMAISPAPYLDELIPDSYLPSHTGDFILKGSFFTPTMSIEISGQTINYINFRSDNEVLVNVTTGATEGSFSVTLDNGISRTFPDALMIVLGDVFTPKFEDWINSDDNLELSVSGETSIKVYGITGQAEWNKNLNKGKNFRLYFYPSKSPLGVATGNVLDYNGFILTDLSNGDQYQIQMMVITNYMHVAITKNGTYIASVVRTDPYQHYYYLEYNGSIITLIVDGQSPIYVSGILSGNLKLISRNTHSDVKGIRYVELI